MCEYKIDQYVKYNDGEASNIVDLKNLTYVRENKDFKLVIDFKTQKYNYLLKELNYQFDSKLNNCSIEVDENITLKYQLDKEEKRIIIHLL